MLRRYGYLLPALTVALAANASAQTYNPTSGTGGWNVGPSWSGGSFPTGVDTSATLSAASAARTIELNEPITVGTLTLDGAPTGTTTISTGAAGSLTFQAESAAGLTLAAGTGPAGYDLVVTAPVVINSPLNVQTSGAGGQPRSIRFGAGLTGSGGITVSSSDMRLTFTGNSSSYTAPITATAGTVQVVNGTVGSAVTVGSTATLAGNQGTILGGTPVANGATLSPGDVTNFSPIGRVTTHGLTLGNGTGGATYRWQLEIPSTTDPGIDFDQVVVTGAGRTLTMAHPNNRLVVDLSVMATGDLPDGGDPFWDQPHQWTVIDVTGGASNPGNLTFGGVDGGTFGAGSFTLLDPAANGGDVVLRFTPAPVPEPGAVLAVAAVGLLGWRVRRRSA
jgi:hypothetical protein